MKLIIDISKSIYDCVIGGTVLISHINKICKAIENGILINKSDKLIDANEFIKEVKNLSKEPNGYSKVYDEAEIIMMIEDAPPFIKKQNKSFKEDNGMTVRKFLENIDNLNLIVKINTVENDSWKVVSHTTANMMGVPDDVMDSRVISWGIYDNEITIRI